MFVYLSLLYKETLMIKKQLHFFFNNRTINFISGFKYKPNTAEKKKKELNENSTH